MLRANQSCFRLDSIALAFHELDRDIIPKDSFKELTKGVESAKFQSLKNDRSILDGLHLGRGPVRL